jgi:hypothetical protein
MSHLFQINIASSGKEYEVSIPTACVPEIPREVRNEWKKIHLTRDLCQEAWILQGPKAEFLAEIQQSANALKENAPALFSAKYPLTTCAILKQIQQQIEQEEEDRVGSFSDTEDLC